MLCVINRLQLEAKSSRKHILSHSLERCTVWVETGQQTANHRFCRGLLLLLCDGTLILTFFFSLGGKIIRQLQHIKLLQGNVGVLPVCYGFTVLLNIRAFVLPVCSSIRLSDKAFHWMHYWIFTPPKNESNAEWNLFLKAKTLYEVCRRLVSVITLQL